MPEIDQEHLVDTFLSHVKSVGEAAAFNLGQYKHLDAAQGVKGSALADQVPLLQMLYKVSPTLVFKYSQVKEAFGRVFREHPGVSEGQMTEQLNLGETLAEAILVLCDHARRIGRDEQKFREACSRLVNFQVEKLETIRSMLAGDATTPEKARKRSRLHLLQLLAMGLQQLWLSLQSHQLRRRHLLWRLIPCWHLPGKHRPFQ